MRAELTEEQWEKLLESRAMRVFYEAEILSNLHYLTDISEDEYKMLFGNTQDETTKTPSV